jgi:2-methylisocitrate lyase-like PEP mutase family enzyme
MTHSSMTWVAERRVRFRALHEADRLFVMPNPWDVGSARLLAASGFEALATTSAGFAWALGKHDQTVTRDELVAHVAELAAATDLPLNVDSERCYPDDPGGVAETVALLAAAGAAGFSIEDYDPAQNGMDEIGAAAERVAEAAEASRRLPEPMLLTARAENHIRGVQDLDDTIARLLAFRDAGADALYAPGLTDLRQIADVVAAVEIPVNVLVLPGGPTVAELAKAGVRRVSTGSLLAARSYGALVEAATTLITDGIAPPSSDLVSRETLRAAF